MANLLPVTDIRLQQVQDVIRSAFRAEFGPDAIADFVASVDWTGAPAQTLEIAPLLGKLEGWATEYAEGDLSKEQYQANLLSLLPDAEGRKLSSRLPSKSR